MGGGGGVALGCFSSFYAMHMVFHVIHAHVVA